MALRRKSLELLLRQLRGLRGLRGQRDVLRHLRGLLLREGLREVLRHHLGHHRGVLRHLHVMHGLRVGSVCVLRREVLLKLLRRERALRDSCVCGNLWNRLQLRGRRRTRRNV